MRKMYQHKRMMRKMYHSARGNNMEDIRRAYIELAALIPDPKNPSTSDWPCENPADRECLQKAYTILQATLALSSPQGN